MSDKKSIGLNKGIIALVIGLLVVVIGLICYIILGGNTAQQQESGGIMVPKIDSNVITGEATKEDILAQLEEAQRKVDESMLSVEIAQSWIFPSGTEEGKLFIQNPEKNKLSFVTQVAIEETGEIVYTSGLLPVGSRIESGKLDVDLEAGTYPCTAYFTTYDSENNPVGQTGMNVTIVVQN